MAKTLKELKEEFGYLAPARMCKNCNHMGEREYRGGTGKYCTVGGFPIKPNGGCSREWEPKIEKKTAKKKGK